jgi:hypothetical protein
MSEAENDFCNREIEEINREMAIDEFLLKENVSNLIFCQGVLSRVKSRQERRKTLLNKLGISENA